ncbi:MAG: D-alanyl-D-alanine carboxypeptidase [Oscillospiraceae bacterium]|nr:D-alanyl-D-alanine carboxypeptidase [Oscillospiraceae bacterium]
MKKIKKFFSVFMSVLIVCCFCTSLTGQAISFTPNFEINSAACVLINTDTGDVLYEKNADALYMPGSLVQIMEAALVLEKCTDLKMQITCDSELVKRYQNTEHADDLRYADILEGDVLTVEELLYALMLTSSCEAAVMLANQFGNGSVASFVDMMNAKAQELGCTQTNFTNVTGIADSAQKTTARELAKITQYAMNVSKFMTFASAVSYAPETQNADRHKMDEWIWTHSNAMMQENSSYYLEGTKGIKTANLADQGRSIICQGTKDGNTFLVVLLAAPFTDSDGTLKFYHMTDANDLLKWAYTHFNYQTILSDSTELGQITVQNGDGVDYVLVRPEKSFMSLWYDGADINSIVQDIKLDDNVSAPIKQGEKLGTVTLKFSGQELAVIDLIATSSVELSQKKYYLALAKHFPHTEWMTRAIFLSVVLCAVYLVLCIYAHVLHTQKNKAPEPVHLKPKASAVKREAEKSSRKKQSGTKK